MRYSGAWAVRGLFEVCKKLAKPARALMVLVIPRDVDYNDFDRIFGYLRK